MEVWLRVEVWLRAELPAGLLRRKRRRRWRTWAL